MTRGSIREYAEAIRPRYRTAGRQERSQLLDEFCRTTGYHRKAAIRLLRNPPTPGKRGPGRPRVSGPAVVAALTTVWETSGRLCGKRLAPFLPELVASLERHGELTLDAASRAQLLRLSAATIDRLVQRARQEGRRQPQAPTRVSSPIQRAVPVRTFGEWAGVAPGSLQADLVLHCGESTAGFYLTTLMTVDVATSWTECVAVWGKGQQRVGSAVHQIRQRLPVALRELHTDNGSEFLNETLYPWCQRERIRFTRGRPYKKNDQAYVEQKNWSFVRRLVGYDRYRSRAALDQLNRLYALVRLDANFFQPVRRLIQKERVGSKVVKRYDVAQTPYQRLVARGVLDEAEREALAAEYRRINPVQLRRAIDEALDALWKLAERPGDDGGRAGERAAADRPGCSAAAPGRR